MATPGYPELLLLENYVCIITFTTDLQKVSFYNIIGFLYYNSYHRAYTIPNTYKGSYDAGNRYQPWWLLWRADSCMIATRIRTSDQNKTVLAAVLENWMLGYI
jgi:hypothetical protein